MKTSLLSLDHYLNKALGSPSPPVQQREWVSGCVTAVNVKENIAETDTEIQGEYFSCFFEIWKGERLEVHLWNNIRHTFDKCTAPQWGQRSGRASEQQPWSCSVHYVIHPAVLKTKSFQGLSELNRRKWAKRGLKHKKVVKTVYLSV